jgi:hypothetical protein
VDSGSKNEKSFRIALVVRGWIYSTMTNIRSCFIQFDSRCIQYLTSVYSHGAQAVAFSLCVARLAPYAQLGLRSASFICSVLAINLNHNQKLQYVTYHIKALSIASVSK